MMDKVQGGTLTAWGAGIGGSLIVMIYFFFLPFLPFAALYAFLAAEAAARPRLPIVRRFLYALTARLFFFAGFFAGMVYLKQIFK